MQVTGIFIKGLSQPIASPRPCRHKQNLLGSTKACQFSGCGDLRMIRFAVRLLGYMAVGGGFVALVLDGARSIANQAIAIMPLGEMGLRVLGERYLQIQPAVERNLHPLLWDPVLLNLTLLPSFAVVLALGFLLLWLGREPRATIGHVTRA
jgi:hypothetical protein